MKKAKIKLDTHIVIKKDDIEKYLDNNDKINLDLCIGIIDEGREEDGKKINSYYVVNTDEPYAQEVLDLILKREGEKQI